MGVTSKFIIASALMWVLPILIIYGFNHKVYAGIVDLTPESVTLWSGILAVVSVNIVIALYIYAAIKEPANKHEPDPKFVSDAKESIKNFGSVEADSSSDRAKQE